MSKRAADVLAGVSLIVAEDTRHSGQLLTRLGLDKQLLSLHEHNESERVEAVLDTLRAGDPVALISDAGTPLISDPGYRLLVAARAARLPVSPVPGCCAAIALLSVAGLPTDRFLFAGFLPAKAAARRAALAGLAGRSETLVFYEAIHRLPEMLDDAKATLGGGRPAAVGRELTKLHESIYRGTLDEVRAAIAADPGGDKGECTVAVGGADAADAPDTEELKRVMHILAGELPASQAASLAARITGASRREAYRLVDKD